jgi:hypothetical protein
MGRKIFSVAHFEGAANANHHDSYYKLLRNASQAFRDEIHDVYFGRSFPYRFDGRKKVFGNAMGVEATDQQVESLFRIQRELGIEISLTLNSIETPPELFLEKRVTEEFVAFVKSYYDRGLRSCTIGSPHLIRSRVLHQAMPEMRWKNTVNHRVSTAQQVLDYVCLGYDTILLDRSLCRNLGELRRIRKAVDYYNDKYKPAKKVLTSLLVAEGCLPGCPFKKEHDSIGERIGGNYFSTTSRLTCDNWRFNDGYDGLPRNAIDLVVADKESFDQFAEAVDVLKFSGRFTTFNFLPGDVGDRRASWVFYHRLKHRLDIKKPITFDDVLCSDSLVDAAADDVMPLHLWSFSWVTPKVPSYRDAMDVVRAMPGFWRTEPGKRLAGILKNCKSQCWDCHECETTFGAPQFDSALQLQLPPR